MVASAVVVDGGGGLGDAERKRTARRSCDGFPRRCDRGERNERRKLEPVDSQEVRALTKRTWRLQCHSRFMIKRKL